MEQASACSTVSAPVCALAASASSRDCRPGHLNLDVADVMLVPPVTPDGVPTLVPAPASPKK